MSASERESVAARWDRINAMVQLLEVRCGTRRDITKREAENAVDRAYGRPVKPALTLIQGGRDA